MKRGTYLVSGLGLLAAIIVSSSLAGAQAGKTPTIKEIMDKLHKGANSPLTTVRADLQAEATDWPEIQRQARSFVTLGAALGKNTAPRGEAASWTKLTAQYLDNAKALDTAAQKKDKAGAIAAHTRLNDSCKGCHNLHRPN